MQADFSVWSADGMLQDIQHCTVDEQGMVYLYSSQGLGLVHTQDVVIAADALADHRWHEKKVLSSELERTYRFVKSPQQRASRIT